MPSLHVVLLPLAAALVAAGHAGAAAPPDDRGKQITAVRVSAPPSIDGRLDDAAWKATTPDSRFTQNFPDEAAAPSERTELYVVYDDRALYVGVRCRDRQPSAIVERLTRRDRETDADKVTVNIDSRGDLQGGYHFEVNVSGVLTDGQRFNDTDYNGDWDGLWNAATARDDHGWTAELEIPWRTLRFAGGEPVMGIEVRRYVQRRQEVDEWAYIPRSARAEVSRYGRLVGVRGLGPARLFQLQPYVAGGLRVRSDFDTNNGVELGPSAGLDVKLGLTSSLTLDATVNPDFGQVEADQVVLNLSTYETFFPEKRPFFLEGADLFATPIQQFYTRRVGHAPSEPTLGDDEVLHEQPAVGRIWGATKLSGQVIPHLSVAALDAVTAAQSASVARPLPSGHTTVEERLVEPLANYAVLRLRSDFGQSYVGLLATSVNRFESPGAAAPDPTVNLCPDEAAPVSGRCFRDAYTAGIDGRLATSDGNWGVVAHGVYSQIEGGTTRTLADGTVQRSGDRGFGLRMDGGKRGGEHLLFTLRYQGYTPNFQVNDAGYLQRANTHYMGAIGTLRTTKPLGPFLEGGVTVFDFVRLNWAGDLLGHALGAELSGRFANFWQFDLEYGRSTVRRDNRETRDGAILERSLDWWLALWLKTDTRKRLVAEFWGNMSRAEHGMAFDGELHLNVRPLPQLEFELVPRYSYTWGDPRWAFRTDTLSDGRLVYWLGNLESVSFDVTLRGIYTFTPRLTLQAYAQVFVASGHYSNAVTSTAPRPPTCPDGQNPCVPARLALSSFAGAPSIGDDQDFREGAINLNVVLRWEYLPGSTLLAVYTRSQAQLAYDPAEGPGFPSLARFRGGPAADVILLKLAYLWR